MINEDLQQLQFAVQKWSDDTFGQRTPEPILIKLKKETEELIEALHNEQEFYKTAPQELRGDGRDGEWCLTEEALKEYIALRKKVMLEFADCFILIIDAAAHYSMTMETLRRNCVEKLEICKKVKKWEQLEDGTMQHVKE